MNEETIVVDNLNDVDGQTQNVQEEIIEEENEHSEDANLLEALNKQQTLIEEQAKRIETLTKEVALLVKNGGNIASAHIEKPDNTFENSLNAQTKDYVSLRDLDFTINKKAYIKEMSD